MNILDRLTYKISKINNPQEKQMYQDIYTNLLVVSDSVAKLTNNLISDLVERIEFDIDFLHAAYITKKSYYMEALNRIPTDRPGTVNLYAEWTPNTNTASGLSSTIS